MRKALLIVALLAPLPAPVVRLTPATTSADTMAGMPGMKH